MLWWTYALIEFVCGCKCLLGKYAGESPNILINGIPAIAHGLVVVPASAQNNSPMRMVRTRTRCLHLRGKRISRANSAPARRLIQRRSNAVEAVSIISSIICMSASPRLEVTNATILVPPRSYLSFGSSVCGTTATDSRPDLPGRARDKFLRIEEARVASDLFPPAAFTSRRECNRNSPMGRALRGGLMIGKTAQMKSIRCCANESCLWHRSR